MMVGEILMMGGLVTGTVSLACLFPPLVRRRWNLVLRRFGVVVFWFLVGSLGAGIVSGNGVMTTGSAVAALAMMLVLGFALQWHDRREFRYSSGASPTKPIA